MQLPITVDSPEVFASEKETYYFDRKSARKDTAEIAKHISAFANAAGGKLVIGIEDDGTITGFKRDGAREIEDFKQASIADCVPPFPAFGHHAEAEIDLSTDLGQIQIHKEKKELSAEEKEFRSKRKEIQEKLIKFATRIPVFMYLTDYREETLKDVITQLEPGLFKKVTGLDVKDFELLVSLGVFNDTLMNDAVYKFRRYEDSSLSYTGINKHEGERVGLFDTTLAEYEYLEQAQMDSMVTPQGYSKKSPEAKTFKNEPAKAKKPAAPKKEKAQTQVWKGKEQKFVPGPVVEVEQSEPEEVQLPKVTKEQLDAIAEGSLVFHKAFGYGEVGKMGEQRIWVDFDDKRRMLRFPNAFYDGHLQIG